MHLDRTGLHAGKACEEFIETPTGRQIRPGTHLIEHVPSMQHIADTVKEADNVWNEGVQFECLPGNCFCFTKQSLATVESLVGFVDQHARLFQT